MRWILPVLTVVMCIGAMNDRLALLAAEPTWHSTPQSAQLSAIKQDRLIVAFFKAPWCAYCTRMQKETWSDAAIQRKVEEHFVPLMVDAEAYPELITKLRVKTFPTTMVFGPDGKLRDQVTGYQPTARIRELLDGVILTAQRQPKADGPVAR